MDSLRERVARAIGATHPDSLSYLHEADAAIGEVVKYIRERVKEADCDEDEDADTSEAEAWRALADELEAKG